MDENEARAKTAQILDEERLNPTTAYVINRRHVSDPFGALELALSRSKRPFPVQQDAENWSFESTNYNLLCALRAQAPEGSRAAIEGAVLNRITTPPALVRATTGKHPNWNGYCSELPLVAEFCIRAGLREDFFRILGQASPFPGHVMLLRQLAEMIARNFTVLSDQDYQHLDLGIEKIRAASDKLYEVYRKRGSPIYQDWPGAGRVNLTSALHEIRLACDDVREKCRKARYLYLKGALLEGLNLEINQDKVVVQSYLKSLGFHESLTGSLDEADRLFHEGGSGLILKSSMGHLRSFLENLHKAAVPAVVRKFGGSPLPKWGSELGYLRQNGVLSEAEERFVAGLYVLISDEAVHPLFSEREYARLARNVLIEYALLFLRKLEKSGLTPI